MTCFDLRGLCQNWRNYMSQFELVAVVVLSIGSFPCLLCMIEPTKGVLFPIISGKSELPTYSNTEGWPSWMGSR
jgi:hypothetical protein